MINRNRKIHIVHLVNYLGAAGKEIGIVKLLNHLDRNIFVSSIIVMHEMHYREDDDRFSGLKTYCLHLKHGTDPRNYFKYAKLFRKVNADIVHTHSWGTLLEGIFGAKMAGVPVTIHGEHGTFPNGHQHKYLQRLIWRMADRVLSVSEELSDRLSDSIGFPKERIDVIFNGVESKRFFPSVKLRQKFRMKFHFKDDDFIIGTVGRYHDVKNNPMLIRAGAELINSGKIVHLVHVGGGRINDYQERREELLELAAHLGISDNVHLLGRQTDINMILNGLDVFTLTSLNEGCSNVIQEAMFAGKAIVATNVGGNPELIRDGKTGFLVNIDDHKALAQKLGLFMEDDQLRNQFGMDARKFAMDNFSVHKMVEKYEQIYLTEYHKKFPGGVQRYTNA
jgi:sugar transferase (PEP-CTERM/EpsH1 system associated)